MVTVLRTPARPNVSSTSHCVHGVIYMKNLVSRFVKDESGATAIEYGLIAAGIAIAIITAVQGVGTKLSAELQHDLDLAQVSVVRSRVKGLGNAGAFIVLAAAECYAAKVRRRCLYGLLAPYALLNPAR